MSHIKLGDKIYRTPLGGFINHSNNPNIRRVVTNILPKYKCCSDTPIEEEAKELKVEKSTREDLYPNVNARYMYVVTTRDIKSGDEITEQGFQQETYHCRSDLLSWDIL